jgi:glutathione S-transferase
MKIFGHPMSTCTRKVLTTLAELHTPYELVVVDLGKGENKLPPHIARQPFGQIPTLEDDGFSVYESRAICRYLNEKANGPLVPKDLRERAVAEQWISVETSNFSTHAMKFVYQYAFKRPVEASVLEQAGHALDKASAILDAQLAKTPFIAGSTFTLADICYMPYLEYTATTPASEIYGKYPNLLAWWNKLSERPSWRKVTGRA